MKQPVSAKMHCPSGRHPAVPENCSIVLRDALSPDLALRDSANHLFKLAEETKSSAVTLDFAGVRTVTRSFAHQYLMQKKATAKRIIEANMPSNVKKMLKIVASAPSKSKLVMLNKAKATPFKVNLRAYLF